MLRLIPRRIIKIFLLLFSVFCVGVAGYVFIEHWNFADSLFMTVITLTTVGYGETHPLSAEGRLFTIFLLISGFGILTYGITETISFMVGGELKGIMRRHLMEKLIGKMKQHYIICTRGETGKYVIEELTKTKHPLVVITLDKETHDRLTENGVPAMLENPADDSVLQKAGLERAAGIITVLEDDKENLFVVLSARQMNPSVRIVTQAIDTHSAVKLTKAGANEVVLTNAIGGMRIASAMVRPTVVSFLDSMLRHGSETWRVEEATVPSGSVFARKAIHELNINEKTGLTIIAIKGKEASGIIYNPPNHHIINDGDTLITIGTPEQLEKLNALMQKD